MDETAAQPIEEEAVPNASPFKKYLPLILIAVFILLLFLSALLLFAPNQNAKKAVPTPTPRPTATPFIAPTIPMVSPPVATVSAKITPVKIGRLAFIKNGNIYNSDLATFSLFVKNATPAGDKLTWSPSGNFLAWRETSTTATPSSMAIFNRENKVTFGIKPSSDPNAELLDYVWSSDEKQIALLFKDKSFRIDLGKISSSSAQLVSVLTREAKINQILWPNSKSIIFSGEDGVNILDVANGVVELLVDNNQVIWMGLSPDRSKLLVSIGNPQKSDLYIIKLDGTGSQKVSPEPEKADMGTTGLPITVLKNGFLPYALWFPKGDKLMVGYHYLTNLPLVGIYDLAKSTFTALSTFSLYANDLMIDDLRLVGSRINTTGESPAWQVSFFTIEDNAKLSTIRVIPSAHSPAFFGDDLLPSGNVF